MVERDITLLIQLLMELALGLGGHWPLQLSLGLEKNLITLMYQMDSKV
jgi:hypothetical protein